MGDKTGISWTNATWNPIRGCSRVSQGCVNCYAETMAGRFAGEGMAYAGLVRINPNGKAGGWNGQIKFVEEHLLDPLRWKKPRRIFVNSMSDLFHENVTDEMRDRIFAVMALCPQHTFQVLTKRPERMLAYLHTGPHAAAKIRESFIGMQVSKIYLERTGEPVSVWSGFPLPNVWLGFSAERQPEFDLRWSSVRTLANRGWLTWCSGEPLLGPIDARAALGAQGCDQCDGDGSAPGPSGGGKACPNCYREPFGSLGITEGLSWFVVGGESGKAARPMHPDWARSLRDQCVAAGVPFFFKQWGKQAAGDLLDGKQWHEFPGGSDGKP